MSAKPSPFTSPTATPVGTPALIGIVVGAVKAPGAPQKIVNWPTPPTSLTNTRSGYVSPSRSPIATPRTEPGREVFSVRSSPPAAFWR